MALYFMADLIWTISCLTGHAGSFDKTEGREQQGTMKLDVASHKLKATFYQNHPNGVVLLMAENLHHRGCMNPYK